MACRISDFIRPEWIIPRLEASTKEGVLREIAQHLGHTASGVDSDDLLSKLLEREHKASTGADHGLAIPHATVASSDKLIVALARAPLGVDFGALDNQQSRLFFTVVNPVRTAPGETTYLQAISAICRLMRSPNVRARLLAAADAGEILAVLRQEEASRSTL